jgi:hypothetical protein
MMTRETKVGLVVACSFLCLVGLVLGGKLTQAMRNPPPEDSAAEEIHASNGKAGPDKKQPELEELPPGTKPSLEPIVKTGAGDPDPLPPLPVGENDKNPPTVSDPIDVRRPGDRDPAKKPGDKEEDKGMIDLPPLPSDPPQRADKTERGTGDSDTVPDVPSSPPMRVTKDDSDIKSRDTKDKSTPILDPDSDTPPAKEGPKKSDPDSLPIEPPPPKTNPDVKKSPPAVIEKPTTPSDVTPITVVPKGVGPDGKPKPNPAVPIPNDGLDDEATRVALGKIEPDAPRAGPRVGEPPRAASPVTGVPASRVPAKTAAAGPRVESYDEETYRPRADDTFASISKHFYQSDKYAQALLQFNREHPRAAEGIRHDPPTLSGQAVYIPPIHILEKRHADVIPHIEPAPSVPSPIGRDVPAPSPGKIGAAANRVYQVAPSGETMLQIARTQLGNGDRWREIDKLNPGWKAEYPIPGGTSLRLPADPRGGP